MTATNEDRSQALAQAVAREVASGWRVESQTAMSAVLVKGKNIHHGLHAAATFLTAGMWSPIWLVSWLLHKRKAISLDVDQYGNLRRQAL